MFVQLLYSLHYLLIPSRLLPRANFISVTMSRGRPPSIDKKLIIEAVLKYKNRIVRENDNLILSETDSVWTVISEELSNIIKPSSIYSYVVNNRFDLRQLLLNSENNGANITITDNTISSIHFLTTLTNHLKIKIPVSFLH